MNDYMEKGYTEKVPWQQLEVNDRPIWYLPHHPVTHPLKPNKVRVVYDCAASYCRTSLNQQPDQRTRSNKSINGCADPVQRRASSNSR